MNVWANVYINWYTLTIKNILNYKIIFIYLKKGYV